MKLIIYSIPQREKKEIPRKIFIWYIVFIIMSNRILRMKYASIIKYSGVAIGVLALLAPTFSFAAEFRVGERAVVSAQEEIGGDLYIAGGNVSNSGRTRGDVLGVGGNVFIDSAVEGDVMVAGGTITILGTIADDVRVAGGNILVNGAVAGDVVFAGGQIQISGKGISGDVAGVGGAVTINAPITGDITIQGGEVFIASEIKGSAYIKAEKITFAKEAKIGGDFAYSAKEQIVLEDGQVRGEVSFTPFTKKTVPMRKSSTGIAALISLWTLGRFLMLFFAALLLGISLKKYTKRLISRVIATPLHELGRGFLAFIALPIASIILLITVIGMPLGFLGIVGFAGALIVTSIFAPVIVGGIIQKWMKKDPEDITWLSIFIGVLVWVILGFIPFLGWIAKFVLFLITLGSIVRIKGEMLKELR